MLSIIDTNVIVRFLLGDVHDKDYEESINILNLMQSGELSVYIIESVILESCYILTKTYSLPKNEVIQDLIEIISLPNVIHPDKEVFLYALKTHIIKNISLTDCLIYSYKKNYNYNALTFDQKLKKYLDKI